MRRKLTLSLARLATLATLATLALTAPPTPRLATLVGACASPTPQVAPASITVDAVDELQLRDPSQQAVSWTIEPKEADAWPFAAASSRVERGGAAVTGQPQSTTLRGQPVQTGQVYRYKVTIVCPTGDPRVIDPKIVIGEM